LSLLDADFTDRPMNGTTPSGRFGSMIRGLRSRSVSSPDNERGFVSISVSIPIDSPQEPTRLIGVFAHRRGGHGILGTEAVQFGQLECA